jgi:hypothetical protein
MPGAGIAQISNWWLLEAKPDAKEGGVTDFTIYRNIGGKGKFVRTKKRQYVRRTWKQKD